MEVKLYYVYVIENISDKSWYIGFSTNFEQRLNEHNAKIGGHYSKKKSGVWKLVYLEGYCDKEDALGREKYFKSGAERTYLKKQLDNYLSNYKKPL